jgi:hypothetical protein
MPDPMIQLTPELQAAAAPLAPAPAAPLVPTVSASSPAFAPQAAPAAPTPAPSMPVLTAPSLSAAATRKPATFGEKLHAALMRNPLHGIGGVMGNVATAAIDALAPEAGAVDPNSGIGVLSGVAANIAARRQAAADAAAKAKQQAFENARETASDQREQQRLNSELDMNHFNMVVAHANMVNAGRIAGQETDEFNAKMEQSAQTLSQPYLDAGAQVMGHDVPESQKLDWLNQNAPRDPKSGHPDFSKFISFQDGTAPVIDPKTGKQMMSPDGTPAYQRTYQIIEIGPDVELTPDQVTILNKFAPPNQGKWDAGQKLNPQTYALLAKKAQLAETVQLNVEKTQSEIRKNMSDAEKAKADASLARMTTAQKAQNLATANLFSPYLAVAGGDPILGLDYMLRSKDAKSAQMVEQMYGPGVLEKARTTNINALSKTITDDEKQLNDPVTSSTMSADDKASLQQELQAARQKRNQYLGLHQDDPPQITQSVLSLDAIDPAKRGTTILSSKMPNSAKVYLLRHYGLPIPPAILPQPKPAQPAVQPAAPPAVQ